MCSVEDLPSPDSVEQIAVGELSRRDTRSLIFHLLYALESFEYQISVGAVIDMFNRGYNLDIPRDGEIYTTTAGIIEDRDKLDILIIPLLRNWRPERVGVCTKLIMRQALWEINHTGIAPNIIINEAVELAKCFAENDAYKFVNGLLDEFVKNSDKVIQ